MPDLVALLDPATAIRPTAPPILAAGPPTLDTTPFTPVFFVDPEPSVPATPAAPVDADHPTVAEITLAANHTSAVIAHKEWQIKKSKHTFVESEKAAQLSAARADLPHKVAAYEAAVLSQHVA